MQNIEVTESEYCKLAIHYEAGAEEIEAKRKEVLKQFKKAPVPGNRPGKASLKAIEFHYKNQVLEALKRALTEEAYHATLFQHDIKPFGTPNITNMFLMDHKFSCDFTLNKKPDFELAPYKGFEVPKQPVAKTVEDIVQDVLQDLRVRYGTSIPYTETDFVQTGDNVVINYQAFDGDISLDALNAEGDVITIGHSQLHGFDENMFGMKSGEERDFVLHIPKTGLPSVAGKDVRFHVKLVMGSKNLPATLDDGLAQKIGKKDYQDLIDAVSAYASLQHTEMSRNANMQQISARLITNNEVKIPSWLSLSEAQYLVVNAKLDWNTMPDVDKEQFLKSAEVNVKMALILDKIRNEEPEAQLSDQEVLEIVSKTYAAKDKSHTPDEILAELNKSGQLSILAARIRDEHTLDFVMKQTTFTE